MNLTALYSAQCALVEAKDKAFQIYCSIIEEQKNHKLTAAQKAIFKRGYHDPEWGSNRFLHTDLDDMKIEIDQYGIEQGVARTTITLGISAERYCRGEYYETDELIIEDWLFDDPSAENITKFVAEQIAEIKSTEAREDAKRKDAALQARIAAHAKKQERFEQLKRVFENEEMIEERLEYEELKKEFEKDQEE